MVIADGLRRSLNIQSPLEKPLEMPCMLLWSLITVRFSLLFLEILTTSDTMIKFYMKMMTNTVCNSNLLFIKYIYYTVQVEFCYKVAHMCVELLVV